MTQRRLLQITVAAVGLIPVGAGFAGLWLGTGLLGLWGGVDLDSHVRYLSGLLLAVGLAYWAAIPTIETQGARFRLLTLIVVVGGVGRALGVFRDGPPGPVMSGALAVELIVTPAICLWQSRIARSAAMDGLSPVR